jgi:hypothetical protein
MGRRAIAVGAMAVLALSLLSGCQAVAPGTFVRAEAVADAALWTRDAVRAAGSPSASTRADGYETCRTDSAYFTTTFQWRTITYLGVAASRQSDTISAIAAAFGRSGWHATSSRGAVTLTGPSGPSHRGVIRVEPAGSSNLALSVISPCYQ